MKKKYIKTIEDSINSLYRKLIIIDIEELEISAYNKRYLKEYQRNFHFLMPLYKQLLIKVINKLSKPINKSNFVDYGGGCGILSFLAVEMGFNKVIYNDIYDVSVIDAKNISKVLSYKVDFFIPGDVTDFINVVNKSELKIDVVASFDVLEHIYDLNNWFLEIRKISKPFSISFMTSANHKNPFINRRLKKIHNKAEYDGVEKRSNWKERDSNLSFYEIRKSIIKKKFPQLTDKELNMFTKNSRGLYGDDILQSVTNQLKFKTYKQALSHPTNTCDPLTGNWAEHIIDLKRLKEKIKNDDVKIKFTNSYYSYSKNKTLNVPKYILNVFIKLLGEQNLFLSPSYTLEIEYK